MGGGNRFFDLLVGENVNTSDRGFSSTVLTGLGSGKIDNL